MGFRRALTCWSNRSLLSVGLAGIATFGWIKPSNAQSKSLVEVTVKDLTPKFLAFYEASSRSAVDPETKWTLWKQMYDYAAVPPTPQGDAIARQLLDSAWPRYASALDRIGLGSGAIRPTPLEMMKKVAAVLDAAGPIRATVIVYVGGFENNAFTSPGAAGIPVVSIPVESPVADKLMAHEFTHVIEAEQAGLSVTWQRTIAQTVFAEGLAMRVTQKLLPGLADKEYIGEFSPDWFNRSTAKRIEILEDIEAHLNESSDAAVYRYTMGRGGAGLEREAYYTGWLVVGDLLDHGWTLSSLAHSKNATITRLVRESINRPKEPESMAHLGGTLKPPNIGRTLRTAND